MASALTALRRFINIRIAADATLRDLGVSAVLDRVPPTKAMPYASFGPGQEVPESNACMAVCSELFQQIDIWTNDAGRQKAESLAEALSQCLNASTGTADGYAIQTLDYTRTRMMTEPDGLTTHVVLEFRALVEKP